MSFAPVDNPKILLYVLIDEPDGTTGGSGDGMDSQTLTKAIMTELLPYLTISRTDDKDVVMPEKEEEENPDGGVDAPDNAEEYDYEKEDEQEIEDYNTREETTTETETSVEDQTDEANNDEDEKDIQDEEDEEE